jgi:hypothetical protein
MPRYYFRLADGTSNYGVHELPDDTAAQIAAIELARSVREVRPELIGKTSIECPRRPSCALG